MALLHCNFYSQALKMGTEINVVIPAPDSGEVSMGKDISYFTPGARFPVLYLLHGAFGDASDWVRLTSIERYAQARHLVVVMPSAANSFYQNMAYGPAYLDYFTKELPRFVQTLFPVSDKREDTYIAGLSMGGYGCYRIALENPERFCAAASLSGALDIVPLVTNMDNFALPKGAIFADPDHVEGSDVDLFALIRKHQAAGTRLPRFFQTVGTEDFIYSSNKVAKEKLEALGVDLTYEEHPGVHDWLFWDTQIQRVIAWMLDK